MKPAHAEFQCYTPVEGQTINKGHTDMDTGYRENHPNGYTSREMACADARLVVAKLCANERTAAYKAVVVEVLHAIDGLVDGSASPEVALNCISPDALWAAAAASAGTQKVPPYGFPVIVLPRPSDVLAFYQAIARHVNGTPITAVG